MIYKSKKKQGLIEMIKAVKNTRNKLALFLLDDKNYSDKLYNIIIQAKKQNKKICYICFTKPYADVIDNFNRERINSKDFIFVDVLSSLNYPLKPIKNCIFVPGPQNLGGIKKAIKKAVTKSECTAAIFDTISTLLIYQQPDSIIKFTHELLTEKFQKEISKVYVVLREKGVYRDENKKLINDLNLFADKIFEM